ncbi:MAG: hypothetical protein WD181_03140 [Solirubrobacterales bacterium]
MLFAVAACPGYLGLVGEGWNNLTFFCGSMFFTLAAFIQLRLSGRWQRGAWKCSVAFGISAIAAYVVPETGKVVSVEWTNLGTFIGAVCFLVAALLVKPPRHSRGRS